MLGREGLDGSMLCTFICSHWRLQAFWIGTRILTSLAGCGGGSNENTSDTLPDDCEFYDITSCVSDSVLLGDTRVTT
jgi:hypothetical protein